MNLLKTISILSIVVFIFLQATKPQNQKYTQKEQLGHLLFFDERLSINQKISCATCHKPQFAFADNDSLPLGAFKDIVPHNTPTLIKIFDNEFFNWANDNLTTLQAQSNFPLFGKHPIEMGNDSLNNKTLQFILTDVKYKHLAKGLNANEVNWTFVKDCIASYVKTFKFTNSKYDNYVAGKVRLSKDEEAGRKLFFDEKINCKKCHEGKDFDVPEFTRMNPYQNIGLYCVGEDSMYGNNDNGLYDINKDKDDIGKFKIPSLRNVMLTAPYFHDGSAKTIDDVIDHYKRGGRLTTTGKNKGDGKLHPNKNEDVNGFELSNKQKKQLIAFLHTLTDTSYLKNKFYRSPF